MPIESLDTVLAFVRKHQITYGYVFYALSDVAATELEAFTTFIQENNRVC